MAVGAWFAGKPLAPSFSSIDLREVFPVASGVEHVLAEVPGFGDICWETWFELG